MRKPLWRVCFFFLDLILWLLLYSVLAAGILLWYTYCDLEDNARSLCSIWLYVRSLFPPFWKGKTRRPSCLSMSVWLSLFSLWWRKIEPILWLIVTAHSCARFTLPLTITLMFEPHCRLLPTLSGEHLVEKLLVGSNEKKFGHCKASNSLSTKLTLFLTWCLLLFLSDSSFFPYTHNFLLLKKSSLNLWRFHCLYCRW